MVVALEPQARSRCLRSSISQDADNAIGECRGLASGKDRFEMVAQILLWGKSENGYVPDLAEAEAVGREFVLHEITVDRILRLNVRSSGETFTREPRDPQIFAGLLFVSSFFSSSAFRLGHRGPLSHGVSGHADN
jgi:hypothetical protein